MALYAIGDLHLSLTANKSMEVFGEGWQDYTRRIEKALSVLTEADTLVLAGDTSWGMNLEVSGAEAPGEGQPRLLVDHCLENARFFRSARAGRL
jgi:hypothetical protein